jgi:hypothetical protein
VLAIWVVLVSADAVVVVGVPVRPGLAKGARPSVAALLFFQRVVEVS